MGPVLNLQIAFDRKGIFTIIILPTHEHSVVSQVMTVVGRKVIPYNRTYMEGLLGKSRKGRNWPLELGATGEKREQQT